MNFSRTSVERVLLPVCSILILLATGQAVSAEAPPETARADYVTISQALDGDSAATDSLISCAGSDSDCRLIAAAALHRQGRTKEAIELLHPLLAGSHQQSARIVAELAFEQRDYPLAWAAGSIWMKANGLEPPIGKVRDRGMRTPWLVGQSASRLSAAELDQAQEMVAEISSDLGPQVRDGGNSAPITQRGPYADAVSRAAPQYPREMAKAGAGGWAISVVSVAADGTVEDVSKLFASHRAFANSSIEAIGQWRFKSTEGDDWWIRETIEFNLGGRPSMTPDAESGIPDEQGWIAFDDTRGWIEFTVRVNDVPARAMLDSGADNNAISRRLVERADIDLNLADEVRVRGLYEREVVPTADAFEMRFGDANVPIRRALVLPMRSPDLILGVGLFHASVVQIDYPNKRIRFLNRDVVSFEGNVPTRTRRGRSPQVAGELNGNRVWLLLDTGNSGPTLFKSRLLKRLELDKHSIDGAGITSSGVISTGRNRLLQLPGFKLGPFGFETLLARFIEEGADRGFEARRAGYGSRIKRDLAPYDGILGAEALKNFIITTDLNEDKVHFAVP